MNGRRKKWKFIPFQLFRHTYYVLHIDNNSVFKQLRNIYSLAKRLFFLAFHGLWAAEKCFFRHWKHKCTHRASPLFHKYYKAIHRVMWQRKATRRLAAELKWSLLQSSLVVAVNLLFYAAYLHHCLLLSLPHSTMRSHKINNCCMVNLVLGVFIWFLNLHSTKKSRKDKFLRLLCESSKNEAFLWESFISISVR